MTLMLAMLTAMTAWAETVETFYVDANGTRHDVTATVLTGGGETRLSAGWYVVNSNITYTGTVTLDGDVNIILADGMTMTANGDGYGIDGRSNALTIYGQSLGTGILNANSNPCAIVGTVTVTGGTVNATSDQIAIGGNVTVTGGTLNATTTATATAPVLTHRRSDWPVKINNFAIYGNLALSGPATVTLNGFVYGDVTIADGLTFTTDGTDSYSGTLSSDGEKITIYNKTLRLAALQLADAADNTAIIAKCNGVTGIDITLQDRTLYKDGAWNTLCLPFAVSTTSGPLSGDNVEAMVLNGGNSGLSGTTLTLNFDNAPATIPAGTPFIIRWDKADNITNPVFNGVTVSNATNDVDFTGGSFLGTYASMSWDDEDKSILFVGTNNNLHWPLAGASLGACRAYFELSDVEPGGGGGEAPELRIVLNFGEGEKTGISSLTPDPSPKGEGSDYYTLDGRKLNGKPTQKGLYIVNGKKVVIK